LCILLVRAGGGSASDWAAWVQAIGSLIGLGIAIAVPLRIHRLDQQRKEQAKLDLLVAAAHLSRHATRAMYSASLRIERNQDRVPRYRMQDVQANFHILLAKDLPEGAVQIILEILCELSWHITAAELQEMGHNKDRNKAERAWKRTHKVASRSRDLERLAGVALPEYIYPAGPWKGRTGPIDNL